MARTTRNGGPTPTHVFLRKNSTLEGRRGSRRSSPLLWIGILVSALLGCAARSQLYDMWVDPQPLAAPLENLLVIAMTREEPARRLWEDEFVSQLQEHSTRATPSYRLFESDIPDTNQIASALAREGFDGVLVINRLPGQTETRYVRGYVTTEPVTRYNYWRGRYETRYREILHPSYLETSQIVRRQIDVTSARNNGELIWTGTTETIDPTSPEMVRKDSGAIIVTELAKNGVIST
jgi:hypothetical protein